MFSVGDRVRVVNYGFIHSQNDINGAVGTIEELPTPVSIFYKVSMDDLPTGVFGHQWLFSARELEAVADTTAGWSVGDKVRVKSGTGTMWDGQVGTVVDNDHHPDLKSTPKDWNIKVQFGGEYPIFNENELEEPSAGNNADLWV